MSATLGLILTGAFLVAVVLWAVLGRQRREGALRVTFVISLVITAVCAVMALLCAF